MHTEIYIGGSINLYLHEKYASINCVRTENVTSSARNWPTVSAQQVAADSGQFIAV